MPAISLFGLGIAAKSPTVTAKLMTNFYAESRPQGEKSMLVAYGTPGLELFADLTDITRGGLEFEKDSVAFVVAGDTLYEVDANGNATNRGTLLTSSGRVSMAHNGVQVMIVDGAYGYVYNTDTVVFAQITDTDFPLNPTTVTYLSRRFICSFLDSSRFYVSDIDDGLAWDALNFANAESNPDPIVAVWSSTGQLILLGANTTEFWGNSGTLDFPFTALQGAANEWGLAAVSTIAKYDNTFACLIKNRMGQVMVAQMNGYLPKKISTIDIDHIINAYLANQDAIAYSYMLGGHPMYVISFPSAAAPAGEAAAGTSGAVAALASACVPVAPDPMPNRVLYLGVDETVGTGASPIACMSAETKWIWTLKTETLVTAIHVTVISDVGEMVIANFVTPNTIGAQVSAQSVVDIPALDEVWVLGRGSPLPSSNRVAHIGRYTAGTAAVDGSASVLPVFIGWQLVTGGSIDANVMGCDPVTGTVWIVYAASNTSQTFVDVVDTATLAATNVYAPGVAHGQGTQILFGFPYVAVMTLGGPGSNPNMHCFDASTHALLWAIHIDHNIGQSVVYDSQRVRFVVLASSGMDYYLVDAVTGISVTQTVSLAAGHDTVPAPATSRLLSVNYYSEFDLYVFGQNSAIVNGSTLTVVNPEDFTMQSTYTFENGAADLLINTLFEPLTGGTLGNYILGFDLTHVKRLYLGEPCPTDDEPEPPPDPTPTPGETDGRTAYAGGAPVDGETWLYDGSTGFWSKLKSFEISRHRVEISFQLAGQTIGSDYANGKLYRITDTAYSDNGASIEGEIVGETLSMGPTEEFLTVNKLRVLMETGVGNTVAPGDNPQVSLSVARDSGAKRYGPEMWRSLGRTGDFFARLEWRRLGTTRYFTPKIRITDAVKRVITGASINSGD